MLLNIIIIHPRTIPRGFFISKYLRYDNQMLLLAAMKKIRLRERLDRNDMHILKRAINSFFILKYSVI